MAQLDLLDKIEEKAGNKASPILSLFIQALLIDASIQLSTYIWRMLGCPC